jgi:antitoxin component YwqK of YwqJK toxin-antitoxin module
MRHLHFLILPFLISCHSRNETVNKSSNGKPDKVIEQYGDSTCEKYYYNNGNLKEIKCFKNGKLSGEQIHYREDGSKAALMTFTNGVRNGKTFEFYPSGQIAFEGILIDGKSEGVGRSFFKNGKLNFIGNRHLDKDTGWWYFFNMQGDTIRMSYYNPGIDTEYFDGKRKKITADEWEHITREE